MNLICCFVRVACGVSLLGPIGGLHMTLSYRVILFTVYDGKCSESDSILASTVDTYLRRLLLINRNLLANVGSADLCLSVPSPITIRSAIWIVLFLSGHVKLIHP